MGKVQCVNGWREFSRCVKMEVDLNMYELLGRDVGDWIKFQ